MSSISSRETNTMRVLILSAALLACASAAPSGAFIAPLPVVPVASLNSGDLQGALIDAKVQAEDYIRSIAEKQKEIAALPAVSVAAVNSGDLQGALIDAKVQTEDYLRSLVENQKRIAPLPVAPAVPVANVNSGDFQAALIDAKVKTEDYLRTLVENQKGIAPLPVAPVVPVANVNTGDFQAALIDAKVQTEDYLRSVVDKTKENLEQVVVDHNEKLVEVTDQAKERSLEAFWANEDKKWQALDAAQTAQAELDGQLASSSDAVAKSLVVPTVQVATPLVAPVPNYFYTPGIVAPGLKVAAAVEAPKEESKEKVEESKTDSVQIESAAVKTAEAPKESEKTETKYVVGQSQLLPTYPLVPTLKLVPAVQPWGPVAYVQPGLKTITAVPYPGHVIAPTVIKTVW